ncbi:hypothetical protein [Duganella sp. Root1480D1]|uniref:hypothetical protein n=1 Tax=Duganella sp. Root1480D1 TaxID=1736471 RepID=UPI00070A4A12|nr:hypothetical protein [Duganella sp. Root1480D1]KQZ35114.1 hypothetical protein ASD58_28280 [Duganella sp. Root1480D1]
MKDGYSDDVISLTIRSGSDIAIDIGHHFKQSRVTAGQLAATIHHEKRVIILQAVGGEALELCQQYGSEFMTASKDTNGNVKLVISLNDSGLEDEGAEDIQIISFDGGLSADEMDAYVGLRMVGRGGPGTTRLLKSIISEFAGFDVLFAERLMELDDLRLISIRDHLETLENEQQDRWRSGLWERGCRSKRPGGETHVLHDTYLAKSGGDFVKEGARGRIDQRYWRSCVKILTPWMEERRQHVIRFLQKKLDGLAAQNNGKLQIVRGDGYSRQVDIDELEYNNIVGLSNKGTLFGDTDHEKRAILVCRYVKKVRDEIAHLRAPRSDDVVKMIREMDILLGE